MLNDIIEDLFKIYLASIDSYNSKIYQIQNEKYTIIDKAMLSIYLFVKIIEDRNEKNDEVTESLHNYILKQIIYSETGNLAFEISDKSKTELYHEILENLILEKFEYKNRIIKKLKYSYTMLKLNKYTELLMFLEEIAEYVIFKKLYLRGNKEITLYIENAEEKFIKEIENLEKNDYFYKEKSEIIKLILNDKFDGSEYGNLIKVALNLKDVYRYSQITTQLPENVLFHQYTVTLISILLAEYSNRELNENIDIYKIITKSLFHDFTEYKGTEIITQFKNYNEITKKMFAEIEKNDEQELKNKIGEGLYNIICNYKKEAEGYISELVDKMLGIMKLCVEVEYLGNYTFIKTINSVYQDRFKRFLRIENIEKIRNKSFYIELLREYYIYIKQHLIEKDIRYFLKYFTEEELKNFRQEIKLLQDKPETFLK